MFYAKEVGAKTIAITQFSNSPLVKASELVLHIPSEEKELRIGAISSRMASLILTDLLYLGIAKQDIGITKKQIVKTREIIGKIKWYIIKNPKEFIYINEFFWIFIIYNIKLSFWFYWD